MSPDAAETHELVVHCLFCTRTFPISARLAGQLAARGPEIEGVEGVAGGRRSRVVSLRCPRCLKEAPYRPGDVSERDPNDASLPQPAPKVLKRAAS